ncbi:MAG: tetratricopeptide repeat protein [Rhodospirillaceae bacterium]
MADIFQEVEEDLRRDRYERLAKKYGGVVIAGLVAIVAITAGYVLWKNWQQARQQTATLQLAEAVDGAGPGAASAAGLPALDAVAKGAPTGAAGLAKLYEAGVKARTGDEAGAVALYDSLAGDGSLPVVYRDLAALLSVQQQAGSGDPKALSLRLAPLSTDVNPWRFSARELDGLLASRAGDKARAKTLFQQLADDKDAPAGLRARAAELAAFFDKAS